MDVPNRATLQKIYNTLQDETSRNIYRHRLLYSLLDEQRELSAMENECFPSAIQFRNAKKICYYGAGGGGLFMIRGNRNIPFIIDTHKTGVLDGVPIISPKEFWELPDSRDYLVVVTVTVTNKAFQDEITRELDAHGVQYIFGIPGFQYFDLPELNLRNEHFVDAGAMDGETTEYFLNLCKNGHAYVLEPNPKQFEVTKERLRNYPQAEIFPYGAYDKNTTLCFNVRDGYESTGRISESGSAKVDVRKLDDLLEGRKVTFIKMDIEGSELAALRGAERIIREQKPKLAVCVYHKPEDMWEIPEFILRCHPDYRLYLRHYSLFGTETVLYAL